MTARVVVARVRSTKGGLMDTLFIVVAFAFVIGTLAVVAYALFEMSPFARHREQFRDPRSRRRRGSSPHLE
jgi:hypothetical protein